MKFNNNNHLDDTSSDEDEENLIYKEYPSPLKTYKTVSSKKSSHKYFKKNLINSILNFKNNKLLLKKIISIFVVLILLFLFYYFISINNNNNNNNYINFYKNNNNIKNNNKILKNNYNNINFENNNDINNNDNNNNNQQYFNEYCNEFLNNGGLIKKQKNGIQENNDDISDSGIPNDINKCTFDIYSPDYTCTPTSKKRSLNFNYVIGSSGDGNNNNNNNNNQPIISVIIPFLNTESKIFNECIESIMIKQSFKQIEVILIDDGSTDDEAIETYKLWSIREPNRFKVIVNPINLGLPHSRNIGVVNSIGQYIFFFDSDDILEPTALEKLLWKLSTNHHIQFTKGYLVGFSKHQNYIWKKGFEERELFLNENQITISILYRRSMFGKKLENCDQSIDNDDGILKYPKQLLEFQYDSDIRDGMEDWDFHLKCANQGYWGETLPEVIEWYRRKDKSTMEKNWKNTISSKRQSFLNQLKLKYSKLYDSNGGSFPNPIKNEQQFSYKIYYHHSLSNNIHNNITNNFKNPLEKKKPRILLILPWLNTGGADKFNLNLCKQLIEKGWEITIITTIQSDNKWLSRFQLYTPDIFLFNDGFLDYSNYPSFLCYLINSRAVDVIFISNSEFGYYLLPFISSNSCIGDNVGHPIIVDYNHMEEEQWRNGGHPRQSIGMSKYLDIQFVSSNHLKNWMIKNGANQNKLSVLYINVDTVEFSRNEFDRHSIRLQYGIDDHLHNNAKFISSFSSSSISQQQQPPQTIVILYAARLTDQKKPIETCEIIKELKDEIEREESSENVSFKVLFVGDGYLRNKVDSYINKFGLSDTIKMLGDVPTQDMKSIISACDIVLLPSSFEGISMIFYESMSIGLVPIGSNIGGQSELVSPDCGFLINITHSSSSSSSSLSNSEFTRSFIKPLKQLILNPKLIKKMGSKCKKRIDSNFKLDKMGYNLISNFCNLKQQQQQQQQTNDDNHFNNEFLIQTIEFLKLTKKFEKSQNDFNQLYSLQSEILNLKKEIKKLETKLNK